MSAAVAGDLVNPLSSEGKRRRSAKVATPAQVGPDWTKKCEVCRATPIVPLTGLCGPCTFGESETAGGNW